MGSASRAGEAATEELERAGRRWAAPLIRWRDGAGGTGSRSSRCPIMLAPETPSMVEWCIFTRMATRPSASPSITHSSHRGRSRRSGQLAMSPTTSGRAPVHRRGPKDDTMEVAVDVKVRVVDPERPAQIEAVTVASFWRTEGILGRRSKSHGADAVIGVARKALWTDRAGEARRHADAWSASRSRGRPHLAHRVAPCRKDRTRRPGRKEPGPVRPGPLLVGPRGHYSNPPSPGEMANQSGVTWPDLINPRVRTAIGELYDDVFGGSRDSATIRCRRVRPEGSRQVQRRLPPEEVEELVADYLAGATALALAGKHSIHRTTVLALLERHQVSRRGRVLTPDHIERAVSLYASGRSCASIGKELHVNPETVRQPLLKAGVALRRPGRPRTMQES